MKLVTYMESIAAHKLDVQSSCLNKQWQKWSWEKKKNKKRARERRSKRRFNSIDGDRVCVCVALDRSSVPGVLLHLSPHTAEKCYRLYLE